MSAQLRIAIPGRESGLTNYFSALRALGAEPVLLDRADASGFDGLLLPGGGDVAPHYYGEEPNGSDEPDEALDTLQLGACECFYAAGKPILGICRGVQVINVFFGGTLIQHLPTASAHMRPMPEEDNVHLTHALENSLFASLYGTSFPVNSSHHQAVLRPGEGLRITQLAEDGTAEGLDHISAPVFGTQWHPERMCFDKLRSDTVDGSLVLRHFLSLC